MTSQECIDFISCRLNDAAKKDKISLICEEVRHTSIKSDLSLLSLLTYECGCFLR